jgi:glutamyl-tRNA synthetase
MLARACERPGERVSDHVYRGRLAPSPTGGLHLGIARTALVAWLRARQRRGALILRIEDIDTPRVVAGSAESIMDDLRWLGIDWDEGPDRGGPNAPYLQSQRSAHYEAAIDRLRAEGFVYPCTCSRKDIAGVASAPHGDLGPLYPGTCREHPTHPDRPASLRFKQAGPAPGFVDLLQGVYPHPVADDFVLRRADGMFAYQLAVVVDDIAMGISEVVRGDDLLSSTPRQLTLYSALAAAAPSFVHVPLMLDVDGRRLSKRHGAPAIAAYRAAGVSAERVLGFLAASLGLADPIREPKIAAKELITRFDLRRLPLTAARVETRVDALAS